MQKPRPLFGLASILAKLINIAFGVVGCEQLKQVSRVSQWKIQGSRNLSLELKNRKPQLFTAPIVLRPPRKLEKRRKRTITKIERIVVSKKVSYRPLELIPLTPTIVKRRKMAPTATTPARLCGTIVTKKVIIWTNTLSHLRQKTSIGLGNLPVGD